MNHPIRIVVIGAGAAGLVAATESAKRGANVILLEKNNKTGVKILMSGGTRCNLTHDTNARGITQAFGHAQRFLQNAVGTFPPSAVVEMFNRLGVPTKTESTGKIFPQSNRAVHIRDALHRHALEAGVDIHLCTGVQYIQRDAENLNWIVATEKESISAHRVVVTAGGRSWPGCGTTGDAYAWLESLGHTIVRTRPALVPLVGGHAWMNELSGLTLPDCIASVYATDGNKKRKPLIERRASWLFTHFGFSGPAAMDVSGTMTAAESISDVNLEIDLLPEFDEAELRRAFANRIQEGKKSVGTIINRWLPSRLAEAIVSQSGGNVAISELSRSQLQRLVASLKQMQIPVSGTKGFAKAEVTAGGVQLSEVDPRSMASRKAEGLYIAGEVLDVDGWIGGYNFQAAFSTGRAAGIAAATL